MGIRQLLASGETMFSCEIFPPKKTGAPIDAHALAAQTARLSPAFISVTCSKDDDSPERTISLSRDVQALGVPTLSHMLCVSLTRAKARDTLEKLRQYGVDSVLALRGDLPDGEPAPRDYLHASDLIGEIRAFGGFCIGAACYPEGHPESPSLDSDLDNLKRKADQGADFFITQMFFDNHILYNYLYRAMLKGVRAPVIAGVMPVCNASQMKRICALSNASLPPRFTAILDKFGGDPAAMRQAGIAYATEQIIDLIANGVPRIHLYTMNKPEIAARIMHNLSDILKPAP